MRFNCYVRIIALKDATKEMRALRDWADSVEQCAKNLEAAFEVEKSRAMRLEVALEVEKTKSLTQTLRVEY